MKYQVIYRTFPTDDIKGAVLELLQNDYLILINSELPESEQEEALQHELYHIRQDHFRMLANKERTLNQIELETHTAIKGVK